ncbi:MAG: helix-turn-helix domain-containing protein [Deltaproteobacteria bacterium]|nr:helix-turn-helix domain-containing protein [Deltaproteobacteria bacterium]
MIAALLTLKSPAEVIQELAERLKALRLERNWSRSTLADRAGLSEASLKRFETTGRGSVKLLFTLAHALDRLDELNALFHPPRAQTLADLEQQVTQVTRKRGRR